MAAKAMLNDMRKTHDPAGRGYHVVYREHEVNHCPGCGRTHWLIGRMLAECGFCGTALPLSESYHRGSSLILGRRGGTPSLAA